MHAQYAYSSFINLYTISFCGIYASQKILGKDKYVFKNYSAIYSHAFSREKPKLYAGLGRENVVIEHVGSTAVPGLGGKNILDIIVGLKKGKREAVKRKICELGYDFVSTAGSRNRLFL